MTEPHDAPGRLWYSGDDDGEAVVLAVRAEIASAIMCAICEDLPTEAAAITADSPGVSDALEAFQASRHLGDTEALLAALRAFVGARG